MFRVLPERTQRKVLRPAVRAAAKPVVKAARQKVPKKTGALRKSLGTKVKTYTGSQSVVAIVGPRTGFRTVDDNGRANDPARYGHLVELGTKNNAPQPFLRNGFESAKGQSLEMFNARAARGIETEAKKAFQSG